MSEHLREFWRRTAANVPPVLYHYTSEMHLPMILQAGHLRLTDSNISFTGAGPKVVWLTSTNVPAGNGLSGLKESVKIRVSPPRNTYWWPEWSREQGIEDFWYNALESAAGPGASADNWWVCTDPIDLARDVIGIEVHGEPIDFRAMLNQQWVHG